MRRTSRVLAGVAALVLTTVMSFLTEPARASYPGRNGRLAFGVSFGDVNTADIYSVRPDGHAWRRLTGPPRSDLCAAYSPDGKRIAYCGGLFTAPGQGTVEIWAMSATGQHQHQVTHTGGFVNFPDFSPDGHRIAFSGRVPVTGSPDLFVVNVDGSHLIRLVSHPAIDRFPAWSPDGSRIAFNSTRSGVEQVWVVDADGSNPRQLTTDPAAKGQVPDWSPDGRKIAYQSAATGGGDVYVMNADGSGQTRLTANPGEDFGPAWSPDGTQIAYSRVDPSTGLGTVYVMNADGSDQHAVHPGGAQALPAWQPRPPFR